LGLGEFALRTEAAVPIGPGARSESGVAGLEDTSGRSLLPTSAAQID